jgi:acyl carrier protein
METIFERMKAVIVSTTGVAEEDVTEDSLLSSFCADSLETVDLLLEMEIEFGIDIEEAKTVRTVRDAVALVNRK